MIVVPAGHVMRYAYVPHWMVEFDQYGGQQWDAVLEHARAIADLGNGDQPADCPVGRWNDDGRFVIQDGRHRFLALLGLGFKIVLVRWIERENASHTHATTRKDRAYDVGTDINDVERDAVVSCVPLADERCHYSRAVGEKVGHVNLLDRVNNRRGEPSAVPGPTR